MDLNYKNKSSIEEIRARFDNDVERFSNLEAGQTATIDAPLSMELITQAAVAASSKINKVLDIGCGAGNNTIKLLQNSTPAEVDLIDLSLPMLERAKSRIGKEYSINVKIYQGDFRHIELKDREYDVILAAAVLHHLRGNEDWEMVFRKIYKLTAPGGSVWITDIVSHETSAINNLMWSRYGKYLSSSGGDDYKNKVFEYIEKEDSPRPITYQLDLLRFVGFKDVEILHKNSCFAAFGAIKRS